MPRRNTNALLDLGVGAETITERFHYVRPDEPLTDANRAEIEEVLETLEPTLGMIDGLTDASPSASLSMPWAVVADLPPSLQIDAEAT
jgi:hypothetical protein